MFEIGDECIIFDPELAGIFIAAEGHIVKLVKKEEKIYGNAYIVEFKSPKYSDHTGYYVYTEGIRKLTPLDKLL